MSTALDLLGRHSEALQLLQTAESLLGWTTELGAQRGVHLAHLGDWDAAAKELERVLRRDPTAFRAARYLATVGIARSDWPEAVHGFELYLSSRPATLADRDPAVRTRMAFALLHAGDAVRARRELDSVLAAVPDSQPARMLLFTARAKLGECAEALELYGDLQPLVPRAPTLLYDAAVCQYRVGDTRGALATLQEYSSQWTPPKQALLLSARIYASLNQRPRALASYREAIAAGLDAHAELAGVLAENGEHAEVISLLWPLVSDGSRDPDVLALAAEALLATADLDRAVVASAQLTELHPNAHSWLLHGDILLRRRQWSEAQTAYTHAVEAAPGDARARGGLRRALMQRASAAFHSGDRDAARALLLRAVEVDPDADYAAYDLALLELARGDAARAVDLLRRRVEGGRLTSHRARLALGRALLLTGDLDAARRQLEIVADGDAAPAVKRAALVHLAHALASSAPERALELAARASELGGDDRARAALARTAAEARLAIAESTYRAGNFRELGGALEAVDRRALGPSARARAALLALFARAHAKDVRAALRSLGAISDEQLAMVGNGTLPADQLRHAIALEIGARFMRRPGDYRVLRSHAAALSTEAADGSPAATAILSHWYARMVQWASERSARELARELTRSIPDALRTPALEHNALIAAAGKNGPGRLTNKEIRRLDELAGSVPEALVNLAVDAHSRGNYAAAIGYLVRLPAARRTPAIADWIRWTEVLYGAP